jgi:hypothetical protein
VQEADDAKSLPTAVQDENNDAGKVEKREKKKRGGKKPAKSEKKAGTEPKMYWRKKEGTPETF